MIECKKLESLRGESARLFAEFEALQDQVKMTSKYDPQYKSKLKNLKKVSGQLGEAHKQFLQHIKNHQCG